MEVVDFEKLKHLEIQFLGFLKFILDWKKKGGFPKDYKIEEL